MAGSGMVWRGTKILGVLALMLALVAAIAVSSAVQNRERMFQVTEELNRLEVQVDRACETAAALDLTGEWLDLCRDD